MVVNAQSSGAGLRLALAFAARKNAISDEVAVGLAWWDLLQSRLPPNSQSPPKRASPTVRIDFSIHTKRLHILV